MNKKRYLLYKRDEKDKYVVVESDGKRVYSKFEDLQNGTMVFITKDLPVVVRDLINEGNNILKSVKVI